MSTNKFIKSVFLLGFLMWSFDGSAMEEQESACIASYTTKINNLGFFSKKKKKALEKTVAFFRMLEHPETTYEAIAPQYYKWWEQSAFSRWPFYKLLAIYESGILCRKRFYSVKEIIADFDVLIENKTIKSVAEQYKQVVEKKEKRQEKARQELKAQKEEREREIVRSGLIESFKERGVTIYAINSDEEDDGRPLGGRDIYERRQRGLGDSLDLDLLSSDEWSAESSSFEDGQECSICLTAYDEETVPIRARCGHSFCRDCVDGHVTNALSIKQRRIECLAKDCNRDLKFSGSDFSLSAIQQNWLYKNIVDFEVASRKEYYIPCSNPICANLFVSDKPFSLDDDIRAGTCIYCEYKTCLRCREHFEYEHICSSAILKQKKAEQEMREEGVYMDCPYCKTWHQKIDGCAFVTCTNCKNNYDFATGGPWNTSSSSRQRAAAKGRGFHSASTRSNMMLLKTDDELVDGKNKW